jgi:hypothetical protein
VSTGLRQHAVRRTPSAGQPAAARFCHRHRHRLRRLASTAAAGRDMHGRSAAGDRHVPALLMGVCGRVRGGARPSGQHLAAIPDVQPTLPRCPVPWTPLGSGQVRRGRQISAVQLCGSGRGLAGTPRNRQAAGTVDTRDCGRGTRTLRQRPAGQPAAEPSTAACMSGRERDRKVRHRPAPPWPDRQIVAWCSASIWSAPDGSGPLMRGTPSIASGPDGSPRIVWMSNG